VNSAADSHGPGPKSTPVFSAGKLCTFGLGGILSCFDATNGLLLWRNDFKGQFKTTSPDFGVAMSPIVEGNLLIADVGGQGDGALMAFDLNSGAVKWSSKGDGPAYASPVVADLGGTRQVITQTQHNIAGFALTNGELLWRIPFVTNYEQNSVTPVIYGQTVIVSGLDKGVFAIRPVKSASGWTTEQVWENSQGAMYMNSPALSGDLLFGFGHKNKGQFFCLDARTGKILWSSPPRQGENAAIIRQGDILYLLKNDAEMIVARADGKAFQELRRYTVANSPTWAHPVILADGLIVKDKTSVIMWTWK
jgi:outer membrane protein assembly factor BamB